jgi:hypothetical protein
MLSVTNVTGVTSITVQADINCTALSVCGTELKIMYVPHYHAFLRLQGSFYVIYTNPNTTQTSTHTQLLTVTVGISKVRSRAAHMTYNAIIFHRTHE